MGVRVTFMPPVADKPSCQSIPAAAEPLGFCAVDNWFGTSSYRANTRESESNYANTVRLLPWHCDAPQRQARHPQHMQGHMQGRKRTEALLCLRMAPGTQCSQYMLYLCPCKPVLLQQVHTNTYDYVSKGKAMAATPTGCSTSGLNV